MLTKSRKSRLRKEKTGKNDLVFIDAVLYYFVGFHGYTLKKILGLDIHLSFEKNTTFEEILALKTKMQEEFDSLFGNCIVNIVVGEE